MAIELLAEIPAPLKEIPQPPKQLYVDGILPDTTTYVFVAFVGSRRYTNYGKQVCEDMIAALSGTNAVVVSGLAIGIDGIAHRAALNAGVPTVAVPGSGLDRRVLYPSRHCALANEIVEKGGALLSELSPTERASTWSFPKRNRIMAGLSQVVFVIEAGEKSGTLITSRLATDYNRTVFTVPHPIYSPTAVGPHMLLRLGATPITSTDIFLEELGVEKKAGAVERLDVSDAERAIIKALEEPQTIDDLSEKINVSTSMLSSTLMLMEIKGLVIERLGKYQRI
ncbi:MAG: DNA-processing protein DprA [bacterium]|nr:DNA-processing protein DprA [bacterium]